MMRPTHSMAWAAALAVATTVSACRDRAASPVPPGEVPPVVARTLDGFDDPALPGWTASGSEGVTAEVRAVPGAAGTALRLDFDLGGTSGYAFARRDLPLELPPDFELSFDLRGEAPVNHLELKLIDASGQNVWWYRRANLALPAAWRRTVVKRRQIEFAWGPTTDRALRRIAAIELVIAAGTGGGQGAIEIDRLALRPRTPVPVPPPTPTATSSSGADPAAAVDGDAATAWHSDPAGGALTIDLAVERDLAGLLVRWSPDGAATDYRVELSPDGRTWAPAAAVTGGDGGLDPIPLPDASARYLRLALPAGRNGQRLAEVTIVDAAAAPTANAFMAVVAAANPRGAFPRAQRGEQPYWTVVGADGGGRTGLLSEDGALELEPGGASVEPFVATAAGTASWATVDAIEQSLEDRYLPIPRVTWRSAGWSLAITALATTGADRAHLAARYTLTNTTARPLAATLVLAIRPLQVNPPTQFLNIAGGVRPIHRLAWTGDAVAIDGTPALRPLTAPAQVGLWPLHAIGYPVAPLPAAARAASVNDPAGFASGALGFALTVPPGGSASVVVIAPRVGGLPPAPLAASAAAWFDAELAAARTAWHATLDRVGLRVPPAGQAVVDTLRTSLAYMLISRDGPVLRPGTRSYARAWIRDGAMISEALLRLGRADVAQAFLRWYAPYQFPSGRVPCCVEPTGAVPVPEHDSHGQLVFLAAAHYRYTGDRAQLVAVWPNVRAAARALDELRRSERTPANQTPGRRARYGLLPPSISHEGYSARPAYSYWDNFWGVRGLADAAWIAAELGHTTDAAAFAAARDEFRADVLASVASSAAEHRVAYIPGAADLGDFDATSTTIGLDPGGLQRALPADLLAATFERGWQQLAARGPGAIGWEDYTPYELRLVGSFVRLGWRARAMAALERYLQDRRPVGWNQWAEVVGRLPRAPRFLGDMPHAWVHSDYARSALDLFAYHRLDDDALVLAAGIPPAWLAGTGIGVERLATPFGPLSYTAATTGDELVVRVGPGRVPPGGLAIPWPFDGPPRRATVDGRAATWTGDRPELVIHRRPATVRLERPGAPP
jgi:hypothetical protein